MKIRHLLCNLALFAAATTSAFAQNYPTRPVTVIMPYTAGSPIDVIVRAVMTEAGPRLGQSIVVDNKPGALTRLGIDQIRRSPADGYTLAVTTDGLSITQPIADPEFKFESGRDYVPISFLVQFPLVLAANKNVPVNDVKGLVEYVKANPGKVTVAGGPGSISHIAFERFNLMTGGHMIFVPYKDTNQAFPDMVAGRIDLMFSGVNLRDSIQANMLKGLATTGDKRWVAFPGYPTLKEAGVDMTTAFWMGIVAAPGTPNEVVSKLNQAIGAALQSESVLKRMAEFGMAHGPSTPEQFDAFIKSELRVWTPVIKAAGIKVR